MEQNSDLSGMDARHAAISQLIQEDKLQQAIKAMLDLARDFSLDREHQRGIILCANNLRVLSDGERRYGATDSSRRERNEILDRLLRIADTLRDEVAARPTSAEAPTAGDSRAPHAPDHGTFESSRQAFIERRRSKQALPAAIDHRPLFRCSNISRKQQSRALSFTLSNVSIEIRAGEITGLVGLNGSGKSTLLKIIAGVLAVDDGEISYPALAEGLQWGQIRDQIAYIPQQLKAWSGVVEDNLADHASMRGITGQENEDAVDFILYRLGLERFRQATWQQLSGGIQMRCELARALVWRPRLLVLDEPLAPLDDEAQQLFLRDVRELAKSLVAPKGVIISSQHLHEMESFSDQLLVLAEGTPSYYGPIHEVGAKRAFNTFEFSCSASAGQLRGILEALPIERFEQIGPRFILQVPRGVTGNDVLRVLLRSEELQMEYFRDLGRSSRQLLHHEPST
jgi:ABC-2 type transport system ATP-binding protein